MWGVYSIPSEQVLAVEPFLVQHTSIKWVFAYISQYQSNQQPQALGRFFHGSTCFCLCLAQTLSKTLHREEETGSSRSSPEPVTEALRGEDRGNDFLFRSVWKEYVSVTGFEGLERNPCKLWNVKTELSSCPLTSFTWSHSSGSQA